MRDLLKVFNSTQMGVIAYCIEQKINSLINLYGKNEIWEVLGIFLCKLFSQGLIHFFLLYSNKNKTKQRYKLKKQNSGL